MPEYKLFYRRHLPHIQPPGATLFVTFRLHGSIPQQVMATLREAELALESEFANLPDDERVKRILEERKKAFARWDAVLDSANTGPIWLRDKEVAAVVANSLHHLDGQKYDLLAYCIMLNHAHVVFTPLLIDDESRGYYALSSIMQSIKGYTAWKANRILGRRGAFWQDESYDHFVRDDLELARIIRYVLHNPVKAGLAQSVDDWEWSFCKLEL